MADYCDRRNIERSETEPREMTFFCQAEEPETEGQSHKK
jgi:hypothetical protein